MIAASLPSNVVCCGSFPSKLGRPKQKEAAREGHLRITAENDFVIE
jgi:hypothetical protein